MAAADIPWVLMKMELSEAVGISASSHVRIVHPSQIQNSALPASRGRARPALRRLRQAPTAYLPRVKTTPAQGAVFYPPGRSKNPGFCPNATQTSFQAPQNHSSESTHLMARRVNGENQAAGLGAARSTRILRGGHLSVHEPAHSTHDVHSRASSVVECTIAIDSSRSLETVDRRPKGATV